MLEAVVGQGADSVAPGSDAHLDLDERVDIAHLLSRIAAPTLLIAGAEDRWVDPAHSRAIQDAVPHAQLEVLPFGHLVIQEGAVAVASLLQAHLDEAR
jgi:pimeloyl-ACP methyl ester carboxylesterase